MAAFLPGVRSHHERYDGEGYPDGLQGEDIPLFGRIIAVADAFDAMTSDRPYRKGLDASTAISILEEGRGTQWDPYFVGLFIEAYHEKVSS
ncbi:Cyclic di-GMP phosphodiesterase response regulator RpfG [compost metagenome]